MMSLLEEATKQRQVRNRILIHLGNITKMEELLKRMRVHENYSKIEILRLQSPMQTKVTALIVDRKLSLEIVVKDDTKDNPAETIGLTTCSISEATFGLMFLYLRPCGCNRNCIAAANFEIVSYYVITTSLFQSQIFCIVLMVQITCAHTV